MPVKIVRGVQPGKSVEQRDFNDYRVLAGIHIEPDWAATKPDDWDDSIGVWQRPSMQYSQGEVVSSPTDLVEKFGHQKFAYVNQPRKAAQAGAPAPANLANFPGGQVSSGFQGTVGVPEGVETPTGRPQVSGQATKLGIEVPNAPGTDSPNKGKQSKTIEQEYSDGKGYDSMTVDELKQVASSEEVDISKATHKADIIRELRKADKK